MAQTSASYPTQAALIGKKVFLRPASAEDIANTYHWFLHSDPARLSAEPFTLVTPKEAAEAFSREEKNVHNQRLIVVRKKDKMPVGWINHLNMNSLNRSTELEILIDPEERRQGYAFEALDLLCDYLFTYRDLNKVYVEVSSLNEAAAKLFKSIGFKLDGTLRRQYYYDHEFHDGLIFSLLAHEF